ncbi:hypothetical protein WN943_029624 [Citrus x changshan-huyou]
MAAGVGLSPLIIKSDSSSVVHFILIGISSRGEMTWIISEISTSVDKDNQYRLDENQDGEDGSHIHCYMKEVFAIHVI